MKHFTIPQIIGDKGIFTDGDWVESKDQDPRGRVRLIQLADIGDGVFLNKSNRRLTREKAIQLRCTFLKKGDILIARMPDPLGRCCVFPGLDEECVTVVDVCIVRISNSIHHAPFVASIINSNDIRTQIERQSTGTTRKRISRGNLGKIKVPLPPLEDQKRIAHVLGKVEGLIARRKQHLQQLDDLLKSVFLEMFGDPLSNPHSYPKFESSQIAKKEKFAIVDGPFGSSLKPEDYLDSGIPIIRINNIRPKGFWNDDYRYISEDKYRELIRSKVVRDDILMARVGHTIGKTCVFNQDFKALLSTTGVCKISIDTQMANIPFIHHQLNLPQYISYIKSFVVGGGQPYLNLSKIKAFKVICPPLDQQDKFAAIVEKVEGLKSRYQRSLTDLEQLYGVLSQKAFKGELDLSRVPLPTEGPDLAEEVKYEAEEKQPKEPLLELPEPEELTIMMKSADGCKELLGRWLTSWLDQLGNAPFEAQSFMETTRQWLWELTEDESPDWGVAEYDQLKTWVFEALEQGRLIQSYDDVSNRTRITAAKG